MISRGFVFALTTKGMLSVWDVPGKRAVVAEQSISHLLEGKGKRLFILFSSQSYVIPLFSLNH
jgi:hypothetical protein